MQLSPQMISLPNGVDQPLLPSISQLFKFFWHFTKLFLLKFLPIPRLYHFVAQKFSSTGRIAKFCCERQYFKLWRLVSKQKIDTAQQSINPICCAIWHSATKCCAQQFVAKYKPAPTVRDGCFWSDHQPQLMRVKCLAQGNPAKLASRNGGLTRYQLSHSTCVGL